MLSSNKTFLKMNMQLICLVLDKLMNIMLSINYVIYDHQLQDRLESNFLESIKQRYNNVSSNQFTRSLDNFQQTQHCCGYNGFEDWKDSNFMKENHHYPLSCCMKTVYNCTGNLSETLYKVV